MFRIKQKEKFFELREIRAGVSQFWVLYSIYYIDRRTIYHKEKCHNYYIAILTVNKEIQEATEYIQQSSYQITDWNKDLKIKLNQQKSTQINFTDKNYKRLISDNIVPYENTAKYLGLTLDARLQWKVKNKKEELEQKYRK